MKKVVAFCLPLLLVASIASAQDWGYMAVANNMDGPVDVRVADLNGDTFPDLVTTTYYGGTLSWWENDGDAQYTQHDIITDMPGLVRVDLDDIDADGTIDIAYAREGYGAADHRAGWLSNDNGDGSVWTDHPISVQSIGNMGMPWQIELFDMDSDGDLDAAITGSQIGWFRNPGDGVSYWTRTDVDFNEFQRVGIAQGDFNGDGRIDIVSARGNGIAWWNDLSIGSNGTNWQYFSVGNNYEHPKAIAVGDLNGDGDLDIVTCGDVGDGSTVSVFENFSGTGSSWDRIDISWGFYGVMDIGVVDMDGDGDLDIYGAAIGDDEVAWWENLGDHNYVKHVVSILYNGAVAVEATNIDMDDDIELIGVAHYAARVGFWDMNSSTYGLVLNLTPSADPLQVPQGGTFQYDLYFTATNTTGNLLAQYWIYANLQNGREYNISKNQFTYVSGNIFDLTLTQGVNGAPPGFFTMCVGVDVANEYVTDCFEFEVVPAQNADIGGEIFPLNGFEWVAKPVSNEAADFETSESMPSEYALNAAYPNPFNPTTTISVALPEAADLTVVVFNIAGQQVAELANGQFNAGQHNLTFDASSLASGLYFIQATVPGELNQIQKVSLLK